MAETIEYRNCTIDGSTVGFVLKLREAVAASAAQVAASVEALNNIPVKLVDEKLVLSNQATSNLKRAPTVAPVITAGPGKTGLTYRSKPQYNNTAILAQGFWRFNEASSSDSTKDWSFNNRTAQIVGSVPQASFSGPMDTATDALHSDWVPNKPRLFTPGNYFTIPTGRAITGMAGDSGLRLLGPLTILAWVRVNDLSVKRPIMTFTGPSGGGAQRNTQYALSIKTNGIVESNWQNGDRVDNITLGTTPISVGSFYFVGLQRQSRTFPGIISIGGTDVVGVGTSWSTGADKILVGDWIQLSGVDTRFHQVISVPDDTHLSIDATIADQTNLTIAGVRTKITVGDTAGNYNIDTVVDGLPMPSGGSDPINSLGTINNMNFYIGYDATTGVGMDGAMQTAAIYNTSLADADIRRVWQLSYADYVLSGRKLNRTLVTDITNGSTVFANYTYASSLAATVVTATDITSGVDTMLSASVNKDVTDTKSLAATIGAPDPASMTNKEYLENSLSAYGLQVANGQVFIKGTADTVGYHELANTVGSSVAANALLLGKPRGSFILISIVEDIHEETKIDSCGDPVVTTIVTERIVGVNIPIPQALINAGTTDISRLKLKLFWVGAIPRQDSGATVRLKAFGLVDDNLAVALLGSSNSQLKVFIIPLPDIRQRLISISADPADADKLLIDRPPTKIDLLPDSKQVRLAVDAAIQKPGGATIDGQKNPAEPALIVAGTVDFKKTFSITAAIQPAVDAGVAAGNRACIAIIAILEDMIDTVSRELDRLSKAIAPFSLQLNANIKLAELSMNVYIPCLVNGTATIGGGEIGVGLDLTLGNLIVMAAELQATGRAIQQATGATNNLLCLPETLINAILGGVCGIPTPTLGCDKIEELKELMNRLKDLIATVRRLLVKFLSIHAALGGSVTNTTNATLAIQSQIPCLQPISSFLSAL